jgi:hypothetical protein
MKKLFFSLALLLSSSFVYSSHIVKHSSIQSEFFLEDNVLTGIVCSQTSRPFLDIKKGSAHRRVYAGFTDSSLINKRHKYIFKKCGSKFKYISYFSSRIPRPLISNPSWKLMGSFNFKPLQLISNKKKIGILYHTWHCPVSQENPSNIFDISKSLTNIDNWGPIGWPHWIGKPFDNYYCLSQNKNLVKEHAIQLKNAGIDYIYIDITNWPKAYKSRSALTNEFKDKIHEPIKVILQTYKELEAQGIATPKIVPWIGATTAVKGSPVDYTYSVVRWVKEYFYPNSKGYTFKRIGSKKPLILVKVANVPEPNSNTPRYAWKRVSNAISNIKNIFDVKPMWGYVNSLSSITTNGLNRGHIWSFLEECKTNNKKVVANCLQRKTANQISISPAYQYDHMLNPRSKSKRLGRTLYQQYIQSFNSQIKYLSITGWNEWIAKRLCFGNKRWGNAPAVLEYDDFQAHDRIRCLPNKEFINKGGRNYPLFVDNLNYNFSRDIEPNPANSDCYFQLMRQMNINNKKGLADLKGSEKQLFKSYCNFDLRK